MTELRFAPGVQETLDGQLETSPNGSSACPIASCSMPTTARRPPSPSTPRPRAGTVLVRRSSLEDVFLRLTGRSLID